MMPSGFAVQQEMEEEKDRQNRVVVGTEDTAAY
jgi:hypothetical protein